MKLKLNVVTVSTRPTRVGPAITKWFVDFAKAESADTFDVENVDLAAFNLPVFDEPKHPRFGEYEHAHTKAWSASVAAADAFVFVVLLLYATVHLLHFSTCLVLYVAVPVCRR